MDLILQTGMTVVIIPVNIYWSAIIKVESQNSPNL